MADIFISYAREDRPLVQRLAGQLERRGWSVWWDHHVLAGKHYDDEISRALEDARAAIVVWSVHSVGSRWVRAEANEAFQREILVPVQFDDSVVPMPFRMLQGIRLEGRAMMQGSRAFQELVAALEALLADGRAPAPPVQPALEPAAAPLSTEITIEPIAETAAPMVESAFIHRKRLILALAAAAGVIVLGTLGYVTTLQDSPEPPAPAANGQAVQPAAPAPVAASVPPPVAEPVETPANGAASAPIEAPASIRHFVEVFLTAMEGVDYDAMVAMYAPQVQYFDSGVVDHDFIRKDRGSFHQRWPSRRLRIDGHVMCAAAADNKDCAGSRVSLTFTVRFVVSSPSRNESREGLTEVTMVLDVLPASGSDPARYVIVEQKERIRS